MTRDERMAAYLKATFGDQTASMTDGDWLKLARLALRAVDGAE